MIGEKDPKKLEAAIVALLRKHDSLKADPLQFWTLEDLTSDDPVPAALMLAVNVLVLELDLLGVDADETSPRLATDAGLDGEYGDTLHNMFVALALRAA
ncbi:MAG: hypothetical protein HY834_14815 [Devosia nanyangense]|uniref:Uncharacterized protein n=1 Tax=Devosia nanyangense TaxID=1228055 RepID=A0A933NXJ9_9HYPH|nr:hypothetical protein [Devosia nanyangense]